jgi:hypothetical protein
VSPASRRARRRLPRLTGVVALTIGLVTVPLAAEAQQASRVPRIGALVVAAPGFRPVEGFRQGLRELGDVEGQSIAVEHRAHHALRGDAHLPVAPDTLEQAIDLRLDLRASLNSLGEIARLHEYLRQAEALADTLGDQRRLGVDCRVYDPSVRDDGSPRSRGRECLPCARVGHRAR